RLQRAGTLFSAQTVNNTSQKVLLEIRFIIGFLRMSASRIEGPATVHCMVPGNRMVLPIGTALIAGLVQIEKYMDRRINVFVVVPFIGTGPGIAQKGGGRVIVVHYIYGRFPYIWIPRMAQKPGPDQFSVPRPVVLRIRRGMYAHIVAARFHIIFESGLPIVVHNISCCTKKYHQFVPLEVLVVKLKGVVRMGNLKI